MLALVLSSLPAVESSWLIVRVAEHEHKQKTFVTLDAKRGHCMQIMNNELLVSTDSMQYTL